MSRPTRALINPQALRSNLSKVREAAPRARLMAALKANAYGHGLRRVARALDGTDAFAVATVDEAKALRSLGVSHPIVLLEGIYSPRDLQLARELNLELVVHHRFQVEALEADRGRALKVWLKVDTGMHRLGVAPDEAAELHGRLEQSAQVQAPVNLMSHLACAEETDNPMTRVQRERFDEITRGWDGERSLANSAGILHWPETHYDWVRAGGMLYGVLTELERTGADYGLEPAMVLESRLIAVNRLSKGETVGYGASWQAPEAMPFGVVAIGYGDGYPRHAPTGTPVAVNGVVTQTLGRVAMDMVAVDLRPCAGAGVGDRVVLWGENVACETVARHAGTIGYELTSGLTSRVPLVTAGAEAGAETASSSQSKTRSLNSS